MKKDYIYINLYSDKNVSQNSLKIMLKDNCNKIVFKGITNNLGKIKIPICDNELYNLIIYSNIIIIVPLIARKDKIYCVNIDNNKERKHLVTIMLVDKYNPSIKIKGGEIIIWQDIQLIYPCLKSP